MSFLVILLLLLLQRFSALLVCLRTERFWDQWCGLVQRQRWLQPAWAQLLTLLLPVLPLWLLVWALGSVFYGLLVLPIDLLVLFWAVGDADPRPRLQAFRASWQRGDAQAASLHASSELTIQVGDADSLLRHVQGFLLWHGYQSFFALLFCYAVGGAPLALAYRFLVLLIQREDGALRDLAVLLRQALDWVPARLLALSFALAGNFTAVSRILWARLADLSASPARLIVECGRTASELPASVAQPTDICTLDELWALLVRAAVIWYCSWALWVILV